MKKFICFIIIAAACSSVSAQFRVHFMSGLANYKGDLQQKEITLENSHNVFTVGATYDITKHFAVRSELSFTKVEASDKDNQNVMLMRRNLSFHSNITEVSLMGEYDLFSLENYKFTPYFFAGIGQFKYNPYTFDTVGQKLYLQPLGTEGQGLAQYPDRQPYKLTQFNVPFGMGVKYALSDYIYVACEFGTRKLFTDYLDDVSDSYVDENTLLVNRGSTAAAYAFRGDELKNNPRPYPADGTGRGNPNMGDNYYFAEVRLSIKLPWFETGNSIQKRQQMCPRF